MNPLGKISGTITNVETGEQWNTEHLLMDTGSYISLVVKVSDFECFTLPDESYQIVAEGKGLDSIGDGIRYRNCFLHGSQKVLNVRLRKILNQTSDSI